MSGKKIVDTFNEIDKELVYVKNKLDSVSQFMGSSKQEDSSLAALQKLKDENKALQKEILEVMKQISVYDLLEGKPPLALKVFLQNQKPAPSVVLSASTAGVASTIGDHKPAPQKLADEEKLQNVEKGKNAKGNEKTAQSASVSPSSAESPAKSKDKKGEKLKETKPKAPENGEKDKDAGDEAITVSRLDFRVGKIVEVERHPDADTLYVEQIDLAEGKPRTIVSGLVKFVPIEEMKGRLVVVLCNLKPAKMRGVTSEGMVMCASTPEKVEILIPPQGSQPGDRVSFEGYSGSPDEQLNPKKKIWETLAPDMTVSADKIATFKGVPFVVAGKGPVVSASLINCQVK